MSYFNAITAPQQALLQHHNSTKRGPYCNTVTLYHHYNRSLA